MPRAGIFAGTIAALWVWTSAWADDPQTRPVDRPDTQSKPADDATPSLKPDLHPKPPEPVLDTEIAASIQRGVDFLLKDQNADGSWGSAERTKDLNILAGIGSHHAFRTAVTALCVSALIEVSGSTRKLADPDAVLRAIERGEEFLLRELPRVRRDEPMLIYNVWTHAYGISALVRMHGRRLPTQMRAAGRRSKSSSAASLTASTRYESAEGGWGYLDFDGDPAPQQLFMQLRQCDRPGRVSRGQANRAGAARKSSSSAAFKASSTSAMPDFSYLYGFYLRHYPVMEINRPGGSLGRSQACNFALRLWGDRKVTDQVLTDWLDRLIVRNGWLDMGRKRPIPARVAFHGRRLLLLLRPLLRDLVR